MVPIVFQGFRSCWNKIAEYLGLSALTTKILASTELGQVESGPRATDEALGGKSHGIAAKAPDRLPGTSTNPLVRGNLLRWHVARSARTFRVYVVEPSEYGPMAHTQIFNAALTALIRPQLGTIDGFTAVGPPRVDDPFDLVTFPEAFLPAADLVSALRTVVSAGRPVGCVHLGLRPSLADNHLFSRAQVRQLLSDLTSLPQIDRSDFAVISEWLDTQHEDDNFNIGCLFTIDANGYLRVCLHPKVLRSKFERSLLQESHMKEGTILTLITLLPSNRQLRSVTLQPLLCSDALQHGTDQGIPGPLQAINMFASCFPDHPPDHIDLVSVANCTPQFEHPTKRYRTWHQDFRDTFCRAAQDDALARYHHSTFVLANFRTLLKEPGGLSGAFMPVPIRLHDHPAFVIMSVWGRPEDPPGLENRWSEPDDGLRLDKTWQSKGYIAALDPFSADESPPATMLGFTVHRFPRDMTSWRPTDGLVAFQRRAATLDDLSGKITFANQEA